MSLSLCGMIQQKHIVNIYNFQLEPVNDSTRLNYGLPRPVIGLHKIEHMLKYHAQLKPQLTVTIGVQLVFKYLTKFFFKETKALQHVEIAQAQQLEVVTHTLAL